MPLLEVQGLTTSFHTRHGVVRAVDDVWFKLEAGETLGIVGESGSGKSVTCYSLLGLIPQPPGRIESGKALFDGHDLLRASQLQLNKVRGRQISIIFQDPMTSLNPYMRVGEQLMEPLIIHQGMNRKAAWAKAIAALEEVGVPDAGRRIGAYPHEFSGGMRQRVMIAMALITRPQLLIADEPTTALDVTVQAQILELIRKLQKDIGMAVILISHDLGLVAGFCQRVQVMYAGRLVESAPTSALYGKPLHPYSRALQCAVPARQAKGTELYTINGLPPDLSQPIPGCAFGDRCECAADICKQVRPELMDMAPHHATACLRIQRKEIT